MDADALSHWFILIAVVPVALWLQLVRMRVRKISILVGQIIQVKLCGDLVLENLVRKSEGQQADWFCLLALA